MLGFKSFVNEEFLINKQTFRSPLPALEHIAKTHEQPQNLVVTFTQIDKIGINPQSLYKLTPVGIYFYPLDYVIEKKMNVPYAGNLPYINVCEFTRPHKILHMHKKEPQKGMERLAFVPKEILNSIDISGNRLRSDYSQLWLTTMELSKLHNILPKKTNEVFLFKKLKSAISQFLPADAYESPKNINSPVSKLQIIPATVYEIPKNSPVLWNRYLRDADIDGFVDHGTGTIYPNEPTQGVVLLASAIKRIHVIPNKTKKSRKEKRKINPTITTPDQLATFIKNNDNNENLAASIMSGFETAMNHNDAKNKSSFQNTFDLAKFIIDNKPTIQAHDIRQMLFHIPNSNQYKILNYIRNTKFLHKDTLDQIIIMLGE